MTSVEGKNSDECRVRSVRDEKRGEELSFTQHSTLDTLI